MASHFSPRIRVLHFQILFHGCPHIISSFSTFAGEKSFYRGTFFTRIFRQCSNGKALEPGRQAHASMITSGFNPTVIAATGLLQIYVKCSRLECAAKVFDRMPHKNFVSWRTMIFGYSVSGRMGMALSCFNSMLERDVFTWTSLITGYLHNKNFFECVRMFVMMGRDCVAYNEATFAVVLKAIAGLEDYVLGAQVHGLVVKLGFECHLVAANAMLSMYAKCKMLDECRKLFQVMPVKCGISRSAIIAGSVQNGELESGTELLKKMQRERVEISQNVYAAILSNCSSIANVGLGKQIHAQVIKQDLHSNAYIITTLIDMYSKCGNMQDSVLIFQKSSNRDCVTLTSMVSAYAHNGYGNEAVQVFEKMLLEKVKPNHATFSVLHACADCGLVAEALHYLYLMQNNFGLAPELEHYSCIVDALGRSGQIIDALKFIHDIPFKPNDVIWTCLLSNCKVHMNVEVAEIAARSLLQLDSHNSSPYVLLSQVYARASMWDSAAKMRSLMRSIGLKKEPGCSWIEVKGEVHMFFAGGKTHPRFSEMLEKIHSLQ